VRDLTERMTADFARNLAHALSGSSPDHASGEHPIDGFAMLGGVALQRVRHLIRRLLGRAPSRET